MINDIYIKMTVSKKCTKCGVNKPLEVFGIRKASYDGRNPQCKPCVNTNNKKRGALPAIKEKRRIIDAKNRADPAWRAKNKKYRSTAEYKAKTNARAAVPAARAKQKKYNKVRNALPENVLKREEMRNTEEYKAYQEQYKAAKRKRYAEDTIYREDLMVKKRARQAQRSYKDKANARSRERYANDTNYRTLLNIRTRLGHALGDKKKDHTIDLLGCTIDFMNAHLEKQFKPGMTWANQGKGDDKWEIDHIIPFAAFDLTNRDEQFIVCWYQNLQPMWGHENASKGGKYTEEGKQDLIRRYNEHKK
jgi:cell pole-organizing protein PopZ